METNTPWAPYQVSDRVKYRFGLSQHYTEGTVKKVLCNLGVCTLSVKWDGGLTLDVNGDKCKKVRRRN